MYTFSQYYCLYCRHFFSLIWIDYLLGFYLSLFLILSLKIWFLPTILCKHHFKKCYKTMLYLCVTVNSFGFELCHLTAFGLHLHLSFSFMVSWFLFCSWQHDSMTSRACSVSKHTAKRSDYFFREGGGLEILKQLATYLWVFIHINALN